MSDVTQNYYCISKGRAQDAGTPGLTRMIARWMTRRAERQQLAALSDALLDDIGLSRAEARREAAKPFWQE